jgi:hypothetical protein
VTDAAQILSLCDAGETPAAIAAALSLPPGRVYAILRRERPNRTRAPRSPTSDKPRMMRGLAAAGIAPKRIAVLLEVAPAYVYRVLAQNGDRA